ncbi:MAG: hypothetical protein PWQ10_159 [Patescibacteria group bacterium]|nr:hypothetical protein [Patescibacteria group bacterium]
MTVDKNKYENAILYLCNGVGGPLKGKKKLAKLLYYADFDNYEYKESSKSITGDKYEAWKMGPVPRGFMEVVSRLEKKGKLKKYSVESGANYSPTEVFECLSLPDITIFSDDELSILDRVIKRYGGLSGKQLEDLTHGEAPYIATDPSEEILYDLAYYRGTDFSDVMARA